MDKEYIESCIFDFIEYAFIDEKEKSSLKDTFYDEDYIYIKHITGKKPKNQVEAEKIINEYLNNRIN